MQAYHDFSNSGNGLFEGISLDPTSASHGGLTLGSNSYNMSRGASGNSGFGTGSGGMDGYDTSQLDGNDRYYGVRR